MKVLERCGVSFVTAELGRGNGVAEMGVTQANREVQDI